MDRVECSIKLEKIRSRIKMMDGKYFITFLCVAALSFFANKIFSFSIGNGLDALIALLLSILNVFSIGYINKMMDDLKDKMPIPYRYLPDKYQEQLNINGWILISIVLVMVYASLEWASSIIVLAVYWVVDFWIRMCKIEREMNLYYKDRRETILDIYDGLSDKEKMDDLTQLLKMGHKCFGTQDYVHIIDLSCEFFWYYLDSEIIRTARNGKEFSPEYESLYEKIYKCMSDTCGETDMGILLPDFIVHIGELLGTVHYEKYLSETILATIIGVAFFRKDRDERAAFIKQINNKLNLNSNSEIDGNFIRNILFLCFEFLFQYNENKGSMKLNLNDDIIQLYEVQFKYNVDGRLYYFLWFMWTKNNKKKLSENIISFFEFIEYCKDNRKYKLITDEQRICKTQSIYILIKEIMPEQEIRL